MGTITYCVTGILTFVDGNICAIHVYILDNYQWPVVLKYFSQRRRYFTDGSCSIQQSNATEEFKRTFCWSLQRPDLNLIENMLIFLKNCI